MWGGGGVIPKFLVCTQRILLRVSGGGGGLCPIFSCVLGRWGYTQILWGEGAYARFFMRTRKLLGRGGGVIPKFLVCTQRILLREWGGGGAYARFFYA